MICATEHVHGLALIHWSRSQCLRLCTGPTYQSCRPERVFLYNSRFRQCSPWSVMMAMTDQATAELVKSPLKQAGGLSTPLSAAASHSASESIDSICLQHMCVHVC